MTTFSDLEERERKQQMMRREFSAAMEEFLLSYGYYEQFRDEFMDNLDSDDEEEVADWKEWFGLA